MLVECRTCSKVDVSQKARVATLNQAKGLEEEGRAVEMGGEEGEVWMEKTSKIPSATTA